MLSKDLVLILLKFLNVKIFLNIKMICYKYYLHIFFATFRLYLFRKLKTQKIIKNAVCEGGNLII